MSFYSIVGTSFLDDFDIKALRREPEIDKLEIDLNELHERIWREGRGEGLSFLIRLERLILQPLGGSFVLFQRAVQFLYSGLKVESEQ